MRKVIISENVDKQHEFAVSVNEATEVINRLFDQWKSTGLEPITNTDDLVKLWNDPQYFICGRANPDLLKIIKVADLFKMLSISGIFEVVETVKIYNSMPGSLPYILFKKGVAVPNEQKIKEAQGAMIIYAQSEEEILLHETKQKILENIAVLRSQFGMNDREILRDIGFKNFRN